MPAKRTAAAANMEASNDPLAKLGKSAAKGTWIDGANLHVYQSDGSSPEGRPKVAAFDIDGTIIATKSGKTFAKDENDWRFLYPEIPKRLNELYEKENFALAFMTNQKGLSNGKQDLGAFKRKVQAICALIRAPVQVFVSPGALTHRKPYTGMWDTLQADYNGDVPIDKTQSIYVGDGAGRPAIGKTRKKDFSNGDRLFALNVGVAFHTPEEFFLKEKPNKEHSMPAFNSKQFVQAAASLPLVEPANALIVAKAQPELIVMVGGPASGKSSFVREQLVKAGYKWINRDTLKTWQKCVKGAEEALAQKQSVVVDNTNPDLESRDRYIQVAKLAKVPCRCMFMNVDKAQAHHNNRYRLITGADKEHENVNDMVMNMYYSKYKLPTVNEGFSEVLKVNFVPKFKNDREKQIYEMYLVER